MTFNKVQMNPKKGIERILERDPQKALQKGVGGASPMGSAWEKVATKDQVPLVEK